MATISGRVVFVICLQLLAFGSSWIIEDISNRRSRKYPDVVSGRKTRNEENAIKYVSIRRKTASRITHAGDKMVGDDGRATSHKVNACAVDGVFPVYSGIPCNMMKRKAPMFVYISFDDAITSWNIEFYRQLFASGRRNPDGCPIRGTFFNSHDNTQYGLLRELYELKHEIASHSVTHRGPSTWWSENATKADWYDEIVGQKDNIHERTAALGGGGGGVPLAAIRGMRAPFLAIGGDAQFEMLEENGFVYDSSIPNNNRKPSWPFTLHDPSAINGRVCRNRRCPSEPHAVWEVVMNVYFLNQSGAVTPCSMIDGCRPRGSRQGALNFLMENFRRHRDDDAKVPFGVNMHAAWFAFDGYLEAVNDFIDEILDYDDVYIVPIYKLIEWIKQPLTISEMNASRFSC